MSIELKIKAKSLAAEAKIIRYHEFKLARVVSRLRGFSAWQKDAEPEYLRKYYAYGSAQSKLGQITEHRRGIVRSAARLTGLARGFLRGAPYRTMENKVHPRNELGEGDWVSIEQMALRYGGPPQQKIKQQFEEWKQAAKATQEASP